MTTNPSVPALVHLEETWSSCRLCRELAASRRRVVFADGGGESGIMLVGEGPGEDEDRMGVPFVGPAGQKLNKALDRLGLRRETLYITNVVLCRPPGNRDPRPEEYRACRERLDGQIGILKPKVILALGSPAGRALFLDEEYRVTKRRGMWGNYLGVPLLGTFHPSYFLFREGEIRRLSEGSPARTAKIRALYRDEHLFLDDLAAAAERAACQAAED